MIDVRGLCLRAGSFHLRDIHLHIDPGEYVVLMGRTGSGKSLLVRCLCGLLRPSAGTITIDCRDVTGLEPRDRRVGYMPQDAGLFPHMNVLRNVTFSLRARGMGWADALRRVRPLIDMLGLEGLLRRSVRNLSGGEQQKVSLARALAGEPKLLVLDEPVSALDEPTRREVCAQLRQVQRHLNVSTLHVCHSLAEAHGVSDRVGVLDDGRLHQVGTIDELSAHPATEAVARLMGIRM